MMLSRQKSVGGGLSAAGGASSGGAGGKAGGAAARKKMHLEDFLTSRDYTGAIALLEFNRQTNQHDEKYPTLPWLAYCCFHMGDYQRSANIYKELISNPTSSPASPVYSVYLGCCLFYLGDYAGALKAVMQSSESPLKIRLLLHIAHKQNDENALMTYHQKLQQTIEDSLCLAAIHYVRNHFQEATEIYRKILQENKDFLALHVYLALCYYRLDYYDVSLNVLQNYLAQFPDSAVALNLKACNFYRQYNGKAAEQELKPLLDLESEAYNYQNELVQHNLVVFRNGANALNVWPKLVHVIPEARLNLAIYYLRQGEDQEAYELMKDVEPMTPQEYILKGIVNALVGQKTDSSSHLKMAQQYFQIVGSSASECDTIPGRQCMASCFFLLGQFEDVLVYLRSIKAYFYNDNGFNWNFGLALVATNNFKEAEEVLLLVTDEQLRKDFCYVSHLARAFIANGKPQQAWDLYMKMETSSDSFQLLQLIAHDCYSKRHFYYSAKAFDVLERLDPAPEYWEGKRGACCGVFQTVVNTASSKNNKQDKQMKEMLRDVLQMLSNTRTPQAEHIVQVMNQWAQEHQFKV